MAVDPSISRKPDAESEALEAADELPVVARMVVEIRSDGTRTIARGAIEDALNDQQVGVEARADSPLELSRALAKMVLSAPFAALMSRGQPVEGGDTRRSGVRGVVGKLGKKLGQRLDRTLQRGREPEDR